MVYEGVAHRCKKKPAAAAQVVDKTPANNADEDVTAGNNAEPGVRMFYPRDLLPEIEMFSRGENMVGPLADVLFDTGYFGDLTPSQIALHILAGRTLGLDDIQGAFDLEITAGPTVRYKPGQPFQAASDAVEARKAEMSESITGDKSATPEKASPAAGSNVVNLENDAMNAFLANKGDLSGRAAESSLPGPQAVETSSAAAIPASAGGENDQASTELDDAARADLAEGLTTFAISGDPSGLIAEAAPSSIAPEPHITAGAAGDETQSFRLHYRTTIESICKDLGIPPDEKLKTFDAGNFASQKEQYEKAKVFYGEKVDGIRSVVLMALEEDGKRTLDEQKGFFLYAGVPTNPADWSYPDAKKADAALSSFRPGTNAA